MRLFRDAFGVDGTFAFFKWCDENGCSSMEEGFKLFLKMLEDENDYKQPTNNR